MIEQDNSIVCVRFRKGRTVCGAYWSGGRVEGKSKDRGATTDPSSPLHCAMLYLCIVIL